MMRRTAKQQGNENLRVPSPVEIIPLTGMPEIVPGDDLAGIIVEAVARRSLSIEHGNIFVVAQKIVSKSEGKIVKLDSIAPSKRAVRWAAKHQKDARVIELALRQAKRIVRMEKGVTIAETHHGFICANAGVDTSNTAKGTAVLLPEDPDRSARRFRGDISRRRGVDVGVVVTDTFGRTWRNGVTDVALGCAGVKPILDLRGTTDALGRTLEVTEVAIVDEIAAAANLVLAKDAGTPFGVVRGLSEQFFGEGSVAEHIVRSASGDLFR